MANTQTATTTRYMVQHGSAQSFLGRYSLTAQSLSFVPYAFGYAFETREQAEQAMTPYASAVDARIVEVTR